MNAAAPMMRPLRAWHATTVPCELEDQVERFRWVFCAHDVDVRATHLRVATRCPLSQWDDRRRHIHAPTDAISWKRWKLDGCVWYFGADKPDSIGGVIEGFIGFYPDEREEARRLSAAYRAHERQAPASRSLGALGLQVGATAADVRAAFRRLSFDVHPDRGGSHEAFVELNAIYRRALASVGGGP